MKNLAITLLTLMFSGAAAYAKNTAATEMTVKAAVLASLNGSETNPEPCA